MLRKLLRGARATTGLACAAVLAAGLAGIVVNDRWPATLCLYFIPAPVAVTAGLCALICWRGLLPRCARLVALLTAVAGLKLAWVDMRWHRTGNAGPGALRVVHWNVSHVPPNHPGVLKVLRAERPDLCLLSESRPLSVPATADGSVPLPHVFFDAGMTLLSRHPFTPQGSIRLTSARAWWARVDLPAGPLDVVAVDVVSHPTLHREPIFRELADWIAARETPVPLLVMGDFNTPRDARALLPLRRQLSHAYEVAGAGWPYSWPLPLPLYAIDQTWCSPGLRPTGYRLRPARHSDHLRQVFRLNLEQDRR